MLNWQHCVAYKYWHCGI